MNAPSPNASERLRRYTSGGKDLDRDSPDTDETLLDVSRFAHEAHPVENGFSGIGTRLSEWFQRHARPLPWRDPQISPWGILVSEVMLQQTPVARVQPVWESWMQRWPTPSDFARESLAEILRAWGRLGYPRRALRLHEAAHTIVARHQGDIPDTLEDLLALPGIGDYTARAVLAFAYRQRQPVVDVNVRRVVHRIVHGQANGPIRSRDFADILSLLPPHPEEACVLSAALMELGQTVCTAASPRCDLCPVAPCRWVRNNKPPLLSPVKRSAPRYQGSDRQARGSILAVLRESEHPLPRAALEHLRKNNPLQYDRVLSSLLHEGFIHESVNGFALGSHQ